MQGSADKKKVYLVDDHPLVRESLANLINRQLDLCVCGEADSFDQALREISAMQPDLAIIDIALGEHSGLELIKALRAKQSATSTIVLSMHDENVYAERCIRAGASAYIMKRESSSQIVKAIRAVLAAQMYVSDGVAALLAQRFTGPSRSVGKSPISELSDRELLVFSLLGQGMATRLVAKNMDVSIRTVQTYCARIKNKLHLSTAKELLREAIYWHDQNREAMGS
jgi:DNA-binding NarL/FixJ family response regulator